MSAANSEWKKRALIDYTKELLAAGTMTQYDLISYGAPATKEMLQINERVLYKLRPLARHEKEALRGSRTVNA